MKKNSPIIYIIIGVVTLFISVYSIGPKGNFYDYFPKYYLFEMPSDPSGGNILYISFVWSSFLIIFLLLNLLVNSVNKNQGINFIKEIKKAKKNKDLGPTFAVALFVVLALPLLVTLFDYINLSIGIPYKDFFGKSERMFPFAQSTLILFVLISKILIGVRKGKK